MATPQPSTTPTLSDLFIKALEQICYNKTGLDLTIGQIKELNQANQVAPSQPVVITDNPTPVA